MWGNGCQPIFLACLSTLTNLQRPKGVNVPSNRFEDKRSEKIKT